MWKKSETFFEVAVEKDLFLQLAQHSTRYLEDLGVLRIDIFFFKTATLLSLFYIHSCLIICLQHYDFIGWSVYVPQHKIIVCYGIEIVDHMVLTHLLTHQYGFWWSLDWIGQKLALWWHGLYKDICNVCVPWAQQSQDVIIVQTVYIDTECCE